MTLENTDVSMGYIFPMEQNTASLAVLILKHHKGCRLPLEYSVLFKMALSASIFRAIDLRNSGGSPYLQDEEQFEE